MQIHTNMHTQTHTLPDLTLAPTSISGTTRGKGRTMAYFIPIHTYTSRHSHKRKHTQTHSETDTPAFMRLRIGLYAHMNTHTHTRVGTTRF